jgi:hypothetical protein
MTQKIVQLSTVQISKEVADFTVGLVKLIERDKVEDASCAGSGTLAVFGKVHGILTAAHVIDELPKTGEVGIVLYREKTFQKQVIKMEDTERVTVREAIFGPEGPDMGFLRIPEENIGWLKATSSFYNLKKRRLNELAGQTPAENYVDAVIGMIDELTVNVPVDKPKRRAKAFSAIFCNGEVSGTNNVNGYDLLDFSVTSHPDFKLPGSFEGMSGGALWRVYFEMKDDTPSIVGKRVQGIPFYQSVGQGGARVIICHGPNSIYRVLADKILKKWPDAE